MLVAGMKTESIQAHKEALWAKRVRCVDLYRQGFGAKRISRVVDVDPATIRHWLRRYRSGGLDALRPYGRAADPSRETGFSMREKSMASPFPVYATTLDPVLSIARRYGVDYHSFKRHVERYHPELVSQRNALKQRVQLPHSRLIRRLGSCLPTLSGLSIRRRMRDGPRPGRQG